MIKTPKNLSSKKTKLLVLDLYSEWRCTCLTFNRDRRVKLKDLKVHLELDRNSKPSLSILIPSFKVVVS